MITTIIININHYNQKNGSVIIILIITVKVIIICYTRESIVVSSRQSHVS